jgi:hypothetical protein
MAPVGLPGSFGAGETVRAWVGPCQYGIGRRARTAVKIMSDAVPDQKARAERRRRLSDRVLVAFHSACDQVDLKVAAGLFDILEFMVKRALPERRLERRANAQPLVAVHEPLWSQRHPEALDG